MPERVTNAIRVQRLISIDAVWPELLEEIMDEQDSKDSPHVAMFFQLPYILHLETAWHRVRGSRADPNRYAYVQARPAIMEMDGLARFTVRQAPADPVKRSVAFTQMVALIPLWEKRAEYYPRYQRCIVDEELVANRLIVPAQYSWLPDHRAITAADYEVDVTSRMTRLINTMLVFLLPNCSILSLMEYPIPARLGGLFAMLSPGHVHFNNPPEPTIGQLLQKRSLEPAIPSRKLQNAMKFGLRELGKFEHQLFAMNRLGNEGERALAVIGTLALLEWYLNLHFPYEPKNNKKQKKQESVRVLVKEGCLDFLPDNTRALLLEANQVRNALVHGSPPIRHSLTSVDGRAGRELEYLGNIISSKKVREIIQTALDVYRECNARRLGHL